MCILINTLLPLLLTLIAHTKTLRRSALIVHNIQNFKITHSDFVQQTKSIFKEVDVRSIKELNEGTISLKKHKEFLYDLVVFAASRNTEALKIAEKLELPAFYDQGGSLLFISESIVLQPWRIMLSLFGFDQLVLHKDQGPLYIQQNLTSKSVFIPKDEIHFNRLNDNIEKGIYYKGGAIILTPYENTSSWGILRPPSDYLFVDAKNKTQQVIDPNYNNLIAGAQGTTTNTRMLVAGSIEMFSNEYYHLSNGDNMQFANNLLKWLRFEKQVLGIKHYSICNSEDLNCESQTVFKPYENIVVTLQLEDEEGKLYHPETEKIYLRLKMYETFLLQPFEEEEINGINYYRLRFKAFDHIGIYKFLIEHPRPAYYFDSKGSEREIVFRIFREETSELAKLPTIVFLIPVIFVFASAVNLSRYVLLETKKA